MALKEIMEELENTRDPLLDDVMKYFENSDKDLTVSNIQRHFKIGYMRGGRIMRQIDLEQEK